MPLCYSVLVTLRMVPARAWAVAATDGSMHRRVRQVVPVPEPILLLLLPPLDTSAMLDAPQALPCRSCRATFHIAPLPVHSILLREVPGMVFLMKAAASVAVVVPAAPTSSSSSSSSAAAAGARQ